MIITGNSLQLVVIASLYCYLGMQSFINQLRKNTKPFLVYKKFYNTIIDSAFFIMRLPSHMVNVMSIRMVLFYLSLLRNSQKEFDITAAPFKKVNFYYFISKNSGTIVIMKNGVGQEVLSLKTSENFQKYISNHILIN